MKKIQLTIAALLLITLTGYSQFSQGTFLVGGNGSLSLNFNADKSKNGSTTVKNDNTTGFTLNPQVGYFVIDNLAIGTGVTIISTTYKYTNNAPNTTDSEVDLSPFARYYYKKFYGQFQFSAGKMTNEYTDGRAVISNKYNTSGWSLAAGYAYLLNEHVAIEPQIGYGATAYKPSNSNNDTKDITQGLFIRAGIYIYLFK